MLSPMSRPYLRFPLLLAGALMVIGAVMVWRAPAEAGGAKEKPAITAAESWLRLVDAKDYGSSWKQAAALFKSAVTEEQWVSAAGAARGPLGKLISRKEKSATFATSLPGAPDGQYVVIQYDSVFEHKRTAVETITPMLEKDGSWRVSGYFIK
jgi:hypothetical protein